jgi:hypothetical protein
VAPATSAAALPLATSSAPAAWAGGRGQRHFGCRRELGGRRQESTSTRALAPFLVFASLFPIAFLLWKRNLG